MTTLSPKPRSRQQTTVSLPPAGTTAGAAPTPPRALAGQAPSPAFSPGEGAAAITFPVHGTPAPQGSKRHVGAGRMVESSEKVKPWREAVKWAALVVIGHRHTRTPLTGPLAVHVTFTLRRPKSHYRTGRNAHLLRDAAPAYPAGWPDLDKILRSTLDGLTESGVYADDAQVVRVHAVKCYGDLSDALPDPGAVIRIQQIDVKAAPTGSAA